MNDTSKAIAFLKDESTRSTEYSEWFTVEQIHSAIGATCGIPALARNLRRYRANGTLISRNRFNEAYKEYSYDTDELKWARTIKPQLKSGKIIKEYYPGDKSWWSDIKEWLENM